MTDEDKATLLSRMIEEANAEFEESCFARHELGARKYGEGTFFDKDTVQMCLDELADAANYVRYTYIRLWTIRKMMGEDLQGEGVGEPLPGMENVGKDAIFNPLTPRKDK